MPGDRSECTWSTKVVGYLSSSTVFFSCACSLHGVGTTLYCTEYCTHATTVVLHGIAMTDIGRATYARVMVKC